VVLAPVTVLSLLIRCPLSEFSVCAVRFGFPAVVNNGLVLYGLRRRLSGRLGFVAPIMIMVVVPAAGGQTCRSQCGAQKAQGEFSQEHCFSFHAEPQRIYQVGCKFYRALLCLAERMRRISSMR
jgi:hypothetical protein